VIFTRGIPTFSNENENGSWAVMVVFPRIFPYCIRPIGIPQILLLSYLF